MKASAKLVAGPGGPYTTRVLRSDLPLVLRPADDAIYLAQGAAGPLNGDDLTLDIEVPDGCWLRLRAVASTLALPSIGGGTSRVTLNATVGVGAGLEVLLEPVVVADGAVVELTTRFELAGDATLLWREEVVLGRHGERGGVVSSRVDVTRAGLPLLRNGFRLAGLESVTHGPATLGPGRAVGSLLSLGSGPLPGVDDRDSATMTLKVGGTLYTAVAASAIALRRTLDRRDLSAVVTASAPR